jgi:ABC-type polysaccharide/polyol phosphate transport system ATPase subunit
MSKIIIKNLSLEIPLIGQSRLFQKKIDQNFTKQNIGSSKVIKNNVVYSKILDDVSFECGDGDNIALLGHNGSGKTTLLKVIAGIYHPSSGSVYTEGSISSLLDVNSVLKHDCTGYENIKLFWLHYNKSVDLESLTSNVEEFSDLGDFLNMPVKIYSSGMAARLLFSLTTFIKPDILLTDEGIGAGDEAFKDKAKKLMDEYMNSAKIKFFASHQLDFIRKNCQKLFLIKKGKLTIYDDVEEGISYYTSPNYNSN